MATIGTNVHAGGVIVDVFSAKWRLGALEETDVVGFGGEVWVGRLVHIL